MNDVIAHRGPDGSGVFADEDVALGHRRLSILDLSEAGSQPMFNDDGSIAIVFNGEIYNYLELMPDLIARGHRFRSTSDTEVIIRAYEEYGARCVERFNGMWAFAIYDARRRSLFVSRDRLGVKPLYFFKDAARLVFSSEIKAIAKILNITRPNLGKVYDYLAYGYKTANGDTFFEGVSELKPGTNLHFENGRSRETRYWSLPSEPVPFSEPSDMEQAASEFNGLLQDAIRIRFRSDVPVAILLSGGLDSTSITRTVDEMIEHGSLEYSSVQAFSAGFPGDTNDESQVVRDFISTCKHIRLRQVYPAGAEVADQMERMAYGLGEPVASATSFAHYSLMREMRDHGFKVVINGQGADEAFCGYDRYFMGYYLLDTLLSKPQALLAQVAALHSRLGYSSSTILAQFGKALLPRRASAYLRGRYQEGMIGCLEPAFASRHYDYLPNQSIALTSAVNLHRYLRDNLQLYGFNQILHYEDHSSMQHSVEIRSPFVDYRLMELAFRIPMSAKFDLGTTKKVVRHAFGRRLPRQIVDSRRKIGFATPFSSWLSDERLRRFAFDVLDSSEFRSRRLWKADRIREAFRSPQGRPSFPFWRVLNFELWARAYRMTDL